MNSLISAIKAFVLKNRPAYKDYLGNGKYDVKKLPEECVPDSVNNKIRSAQRKANNAQRTADDAQSTANEALTTANSTSAQINDVTTFVTVFASLEATKNKERYNFAENIRANGTSALPLAEARAPMKCHFDIMLNDSNNHNIKHYAAFEGKIVREVTKRSDTYCLFIDESVEVVNGCFAKLKIGYKFSNDDNLWHKFIRAEVTLPDADYNNTSITTIILNARGVIPDTYDYAPWPSICVPLAGTNDAGVVYASDKTDDQTVPVSIDKNGYLWCKGSETTTPDYNQNDPMASDYIKNRPGGYTVNYPALNIEWDGVIGDKVTVDIQSMKFVKVSDEIPKIEQLVGGTIGLKQNNESSAVIIADNMLDFEGDDIYGTNQLLVVSKAPANLVHPITGDVLAVFPETGVYFVYDSQGEMTAYVSSLSLHPKSEIVQIPGELTNIVGGYVGVEKKEPLIDTVVPASSFEPYTTPSKTYYEAPITLGFTPADGDLIRGTINGVEVNGQWIGISKYADLYLVGNRDVPFCVIGFRSKKTVISLEQASAPTTDYEIHLYRYVPASIVQIPQRYVDGMEETTANANQALEKATAAQSAADAAQSTAEAAKTAADDALTKKNGGISEGVIGGSLIKAYGSKKLYATLSYQGLKFFGAPNGELIARIESDGYSVFGNIDSKHILISPGIDSSTIPYISVSTKDEDITIESDGSITVINPEKTFTLSADAVVIKRYTSHGLKKFKITIGDNARPTFTDTSNPNNTWTPGDNLPTVTESDKGKFLRVSESGVWTAEEGMIINSSTPDSTKKFKITVDDTGTISATEVT